MESYLIWKVKKRDNMRDMKKFIRLTTAALVIMSTSMLMACGSASNESAETTAATIKINTQAADSATTAATNAATQAATTAAASNTQAATTAAGSNTAAQAYTGSVKDIPYSYNGVTFHLGDNGADVIAKLGAQSQPSDSVGSCVGVQINGAVTSYYFNGGRVSVADGSGKIVEIKINDYDVADSSKESLKINGIGIGSSSALVTATFPSMSRDFWKDSTADVSIYVTSGVVTGFSSTLY